MGARLNRAPYFCIIMAFGSAVARSIRATLADQCANLAAAIFPPGQLVHKQFERRPEPSQHRQDEPSHHCGGISPGAVSISAKPDFSSRVVAMWLQWTRLRLQPS
jgi:hypothetical protein